MRSALICIQVGHIARISEMGMCTFLRPYGVVPVL